MKARRGQSVTLDAKGMSCPAAAAAFSFKPLPEGLVNGKGLVGFGIAVEASMARRPYSRRPVSTRRSCRSLRTD